MTGMADRMNPLILEAIVLALWIGAAAFFSVAVAPALFAVLPTRTLAGAAVGRILPVVFYAGLAIGALMIGLRTRAGTDGLWDGRRLAGIVMVVACAVAQFVVGP